MAIIVMLMVQLHCLSELRMSRILRFLNQLSGDNGAAHGTKSFTTELTENTEKNEERSYGNSGSAAGAANSFDMRVRNRG